MYIIIGAGGFLGSYLIQAILSKTSENILATARHVNIQDNSKRVKWLKCDVSSEDDLVKLNNEVKNEVKKIIYLAAYHHPDKVEKNFKYAWKINITSLANFLNKIDDIDKLFYPSTDTVYGESKNGYHFKETDLLNPMNSYGKQKVAAESLVIASGYNVVRLPFLIAPSLSKTKKHFYDIIVDSITNNKAIEMFEDSLRSSMDFKTVSELMIQLMETSILIPSVLNVSGDEDLSKYEVGKRIARKYRVPEKLIIPISMDTTQAIFEAKRAKVTLMDNTLLKSILKLSEIKINF